MTTETTDDDPDWWGEAACLWCGQMTKEHLFPHGNRFGGSDDHTEPWHWRCWALRQAWEHTRSAEEAAVDGDYAAATALCNISQSWVSIANALELDPAPIPSDN